MAGRGAGRAPARGRLREAGSRPADVGGWGGGRRSSSSEWVGRGVEEAMKHPDEGAFWVDGRGWRAGVARRDRRRNPCGFGAALGKAQAQAAL